MESDQIKSDSETEMEEEEQNDKADCKKDTARSCLATENLAVEKFKQPEQSSARPKKPRSEFLDQPSASKPCAISFENVQNLSIPHNYSDMIYGTFNNYGEFETRFNKHGKLKTLQIQNCSIKEATRQVLFSEATLMDLSFENCKDSVFMVLQDQKALKIIRVINKTPQYNGFPHDIFNEICRNCKNLEHIVLKGAGTTSYFDSDDFPYQIKKLETTSITHHWYVGLKCPRINFLKTQKGTLKELTIHELPYDFDGGKVLNYIFEKMDLDTFYYGKIPLILNGKKQKVKEFTASEVQITSAIEMLRQFPLIEKFTLTISNRNVASGEIEKALNSSADVFSNLKEFEVIDNSDNTLGVFSELYKNLKGAQKITFMSVNKNVVKVIQELPAMPELKEIQLTQNIPNEPKHDKFAADFKITKIADNNVEPRFFRGNIIGLAHGNANAPDDGGHPQEDDDDNMNQGGDGERDDDIGNNRNGGIEDFPLGTITGNIVEGNGNIPYQSALAVPVLNHQQRHFIHAFGYYRVTLTHTNVLQLESLLVDFSSFCNVNETIGKIAFSFANVDDDQRNQVHNRILQLAFIPHDTIFRFQLITLPQNLMISLRCYLNQTMDWDTFLRQIAMPNGINSSFWLGDDPVFEENLGFRIDFQADGRSCAQIRAKNNQLPLRGRTITIHVIHDPYLNDIDQLPI